MFAVTQPKLFFARRFCRLAVLFISLLLFADVRAGDDDWLTWPFMAGDAVFELELDEAAEGHDPGYEYRQKGMRALGDGIYESAARFFSAYRLRSEGNEPDFTDAAILLLRTHLMRGDLEGARETVDYYEDHTKGLDEDEEYYRRNLWFWRAVLLVQEEAYEDALVMITRLLENELYPELQEQVYLLAGDAHARLGQWEDARETLLEFLEEFPDSDFRERAAVNLARTAVAQEEYEEAEVQLDKAEAEAGEEGETLVNLHRLLLHLAQGEMDKALDFYAEIKDDAPSGYEPNWWLVFSRFSRTLFEAEKWEEAPPILAKTRDLAPDKKRRAEIAILQIETEFALGREDEAVELLTAFIEEFPEHPQVFTARFKLAELLKNQEKTEAAEEHWQAIIEAEKASPELRYRSIVELGSWRMENEDYEEAREVFIRAEELSIEDSQRANALALAGEAAEAAGDYLAAAYHYGLIADELPDTDQAAEARLLEAQALAEANRKEKAAEVFSRFLEEYPEHEKVPEARLGKAYTLREAGAIEESIAAFEEFAEEHSEHEKVPSALMEIYKLVRDRGELAHALEVLNLLCTDYSESDLETEAMYHRVYVAFQVGDYDLAVTESERFIEEFGDRILTADVLLWLADHYANQTEPARAEEYYREVFSRFPDSDQALAALYEAAAAAFSRDKSSDEVLRLLSRLEERIGEENGRADEIKGRAAFLHGDAFSARGQYEEAMEWFEQAGEAVEQKELRAAAKGRVADMLFAMDAEGSDEQAAAIYKELLAGNELNPRLKENISYRLARTLYQLDEIDEALDLYLGIVYTYDMEIRTGRVRDWYYFARAAYEAAEILIAKERYEAAARLYERIYRSRIPAAEEARERARQLREAYGLEGG